MTYINPPTWSLNQILTSGDMDTYVRDNENALYAPPRGRWAITVPVTPANATDSPLFFNLAITDSAGMRAGGGTNNATFVIPKAGTYDIKASVVWAPNGAGYRQLTLKANGFNLDFDTQFAVNALVSSTNRVEDDYPLYPGDQIQIWGLQSSGGGLNVTAAKLSIVWKCSN